MSNNINRSRIASRGSGRKLLTSEGNKSTKLPSISIIPSTDDANGPSIWTPPRPAGYAVGVFSQQGKRPYQEDQHAVRQFLNHLCVPGRSAPETHMFALFDGHAGGRCSSHLATSIASVLSEEESFCANLPLALKKSFYTVNEQFLKVAEKNKWHDGSTGNVAVIRDGKLTVANVGDSRAILVSNGRPLQMSNDHKPTNPEEQKRIASLGGSVVYCMGVARVNKVLAVSRAFGNRTLRQVIRPDAELMQRELVPGDDFLVIASDGLWDVLRNKDVCDICYSAYLQRRPQAIAEELVNIALARGSMDNVTCVVVNLADYRADGPVNAGPNSNDESRNTSMDVSGFGSSSRNGGLYQGLEQESIVATQALNATMAAEDSDENEDFLYAPSAARLKSNPNFSSSQTSMTSTGSNNNSTAHEIPSKQRSLGAINPKDLPTLGSESDPFGLKASRSTFVKAVSTNSIASDNDGSTSFALASNTLYNAQMQSEKNPGNGFLRPLTALDSSMLPPSSASGGRYGTNSNNGVNSLSNNAYNAGFLGHNSNGNSSANYGYHSGGNNGSNTSNNARLLSDAPVGIASQPKLASIRSLKGHSNFNNSLPSGFDSIAQLQRAVSRQGNSALTRPSTQSNANNGNSNYFGHEGM